MDALETIHTRRSIRKYKRDQVPGKLIKEILAAGMSAPSAGNQQPWHFVVLTDKSLLEKVPAIHPYAAMARDAPLAILVCGDLNLEKFKRFWVQDCSAAIQNILLAAHAKGLGAVWTGIYPEEERIENFRNLLNLPDNIIPLALVPMGYPAQQLAPEDRCKEERVHYNKW